MRNYSVCNKNLFDNFQVGEYIIFHVQNNFFMESFGYIIMSKGIILLAGQENINSIRTFAVTLSNEMAPAATIVVYSVGRYGDIVADSLTFPVDGISRNNVSIWLIIIICILLYSCLFGYVVCINLLLWNYAVCGSG